MKSLLLVLFILISDVGLANDNVSVQIIMMSNDTMYGEIRVRTAGVNRKFMYMTSFTSRVKFFDKKGDKILLAPANIRELNFVDFQGNKRNFVSRNGWSKLMELVYSNKVHWYIHYSFDTYNQTENSTYLIFDEKGVKHGIGGLNNKRKQLKKLTKKNPEIGKYIDENEITDDVIFEVIRMYEETL